MLHCMLDCGVVSASLFDVVAALGAALGSLATTPFVQSRRGPLLG